MDNSAITHVLNKWCNKAPLKRMNERLGDRFTFEVPPDTIVYTKPTYFSKEHNKEYSRGFNVAVIPTTRNLSVDTNHSYGHIMYKELYGIAVILEKNVDTLILIDVKYDVGFIPYNQIAYIS